MNDREENGAQGAFELPEEAAAQPAEAEAQPRTILDQTDEEPAPRTPSTYGGVSQAPAKASDPSGMLTAAIDRGYDPQTLQQLMDLYERWEKNEARKAFDRAMASFRANPPTIRKNARVHFTSQKGTTDYRHATLDHVVDQLSPKLAELGLSYRWRTEQPEKGMVRVTCIVTHQAGHYEETTLEGPVDQSGNKNVIQQVGSTQTYLARYTLFAAFGLAAEGEDDDGGGGADKPPEPMEETIDEEQAANLQSKIDEIMPEGRRTNSVMRLKHYYGIDRLGHLPARQYNDCVQRVEHIVKGNPE